MKICINLNTFFFEKVKFFNHFCKYCAMKYAGAIQSLMVVEWCELCNLSRSKFSRVHS